VRALRSLEPESRALLELSLRSAMDVEELAEVLGCDAWELAQDRALAIGDVAAALGLRGPDGFNATVGALQALPSEAWERAAASRDVEAVEAELAQLEARLREAAQARRDLEDEARRLEEEADRLRAEAKAEAARREEAERIAADEAALRKAAEELAEQEGTKRKTTEKKHRQQARRRRDAEREVVALQVAVDAAEVRCAVAEETAARLATNGTKAGIDDEEWVRLAAAALANVTEATKIQNAGEENGGSLNGIPRPSAEEVGARARAAAHRVSLVVEEPPPPPPPPPYAVNPRVAGAGRPDPRR
jgi:hypothetical protein